MQRAAKRVCHLRKTCNLRGVGVRRLGCGYRGHRVVVHSPRCDCQHLANHRTDVALIFWILGLAVTLSRTSVLRCAVLTGLLVSVTQGYGLASEKTGKFGTYDAEISATWQSGQSSRAMRLDKSGTYTDPKGQVWHVPRGAVVDGASIPQSLQPIVGTPFVGPYRRATVFHDFYCDTKLRRWKDVHEMFYYAMRADGVSKLRAEIMWAAVHYFGPRWRGMERSGRCVDSCDESVPQQSTVNVSWFRKYVDWLKKDRWDLNFEVHQSLARICEEPQLAKDIWSVDGGWRYERSVREKWTRWSTARHGPPMLMIRDFMWTVGCPT